MKRYLTVALFSLCVNAVAQQSELSNFAASILENDLQQHVRALAADSMKGRQTGTDGAFMAADYIAGQFEKLDLSKPYDSTYFQAFVSHTPGVNVVGVIEGRDLKEESLVISAHYDHLGEFNGNIYNGADDNASGVAAMLEIAEAFAAMARNHYLPRRSVVFIAFDAKERKMAGSAWYVNNPLYPLQHTIANLNIDAVGRVEGSPNGQRNYLFLVGANRVSSGLQDISDYVNSVQKINLTLDYTFYNSPTFSDIFYLFSDQYHFGQRQIPVIYYMDGLHDDLNKPADTEGRIDYKILRSRTQLIFHTAWELANRDEPLKKDLIKRKTSL
ncbi:MAG: M28 family peptidase [Prevotellaceae bacterium]|jgi:Zn-dependent M28 family amino/carboxypeptidase|nr:M28 family peptidase [Prevotellaceae bacterium]